MNDNNADVKVIDVQYEEIINENEAKEVKALEEKFIKSYIDNKEKMNVDEWLEYELKVNLPEKSDKEIKEISSEIITTIKVNEEKKESLEQAIENGRSKENWFASSIKESTSYMTMAESAEYLHGLDEALKNANEQMFNTITTKSGAINQNLNLDGFIAEQHHANTFNLNAKLKGSEYTAEVLVPKEGQVYGKNSVDIVIKDRAGKIVERYQAKYGKTAEDTIKMIKDGNYNNQRLLVPAEQVEEVQKAFPNKTVVSTVGSGEVKSTPLEKLGAKELQKEAQSGNWNELNWNEYKSRDLAIGIGKQAGYAALQGAAIGAGIEVASKLWNGEKIEGEEVIEQALVSGADFGIKAATAGALKVGVEKGIIKVIPKGTPAGTIANIAYVTIENVKIFRKVAIGEYTVQEGLDIMEQTTVSIVAGMVAAAKGAAIGSQIGIVLGPIGVAVGGFIGGTVGYITGSKVAEALVKGTQRLREKTKGIVKNVGNRLYEGAKRVGSSIQAFASSLSVW